jgi:hypothetical protein
MNENKDFNICQTCFHDRYNHVEGVWKCLVENCDCKRYKEEPINNSNKDKENHEQE